jgi:hypothetical protein
VLDYENTQAKFRNVTGAEKLETFGVRLFGKESGFDWNFEASDQVGTFRTQAVKAYLLAGLAGYTFEQIDWKPRIGFSANDASGDNASSKTIGTFNPMFPRLPYFAETPLMVPANVKDFRPVLGFSPEERVNVVLGVDLLWRNSLSDGLYGSGLSEFPNTNKVKGSRIGTEYSADVRMQVDEHLQLGAILAELNAGPALVEATGKTVIYGVLFAKYKF